MSADVWQELRRQVSAARDRARRTCQGPFLLDVAHRSASANLRELYHLARAVDDLIDAEIIRGRQLGAPWDQLGSSRQQAQQRHKRATTRRASTGVDEKASRDDAARQRRLTPQDEP